MTHCWITNCNVWCLAAPRMDLKSIWDGVRVCMCVYGWARPGRGRLWHCPDCSGSGSSDCSIDWWRPRPVVRAEPAIRAGQTCVNRVTLPASLRYEYEWRIWEFKIEFSLFVYLHFHMNFIKAQIRYSKSRTILPPSFPQSKKDLYVYNYRILSKVKGLAYSNQSVC